ncbi:MAG: LuxR C-terminal-related transcriptional regulator, partial [Slackia sp.]|nr:LuxR C-terminal-related transcriptional regulator [Slackia sp.]
SLEPLYRRIRLPSFHRHPTIEKRGYPPPSEEPQQRRIHDALPYFAKRYGLSSREEEILAYMLEGHGNQHIASELQVAVGTVKTHTHHIFKKTGVSNRPELFEKFWSET